MKIKVKLLIAVWKRLEVTLLCYHFLKKTIAEAAKQGVQIDVLVVYSEREHKMLAEKAGFQTIFAKNDQLGQKMNIALAAALTTDFDYLLQLGSDDIISNEGIGEIIGEMKRGVVWGGFTELLIGQKFKDELFHVKSTSVFGAGRFIKKDIVKKAAERIKVRAKTTFASSNFYMKKDTIVFLPEYLYTSSLFEKLSDEVKVELWRADIASGLDFNSQMNILKVYNKMPKILFCDVPAIMDLKSDVNIHTIDKFQKHPKYPKGRLEVLKQYFE